MAVDVQAWILSWGTSPDECIVGGECSSSLLSYIYAWIEDTDELGKVDIALWDLKARRLGVPIYQLLGGRLRNKLKVYAWIGGDRPDGVELQA